MISHSLVGPLHQRCFVNIRTTLGRPKNDPIPMNQCRQNRIDLFGPVAVEVPDTQSTSEVLLAACQIQKPVAQELRCLLLTEW